MSRKLVEIAGMENISQAGEQMLSDIAEAIWKAVPIMTGAVKDIQSKADSSLVTDCDRAVQDMLVSVLGRKHPLAGFACEEQDNGDIQAIIDGDACFAIDPIDGTHNFVNSLGLSCMSVAYIEHGMAVAGIVFNPRIGEAMGAVSGQGAFTGSIRDGRLYGAKVGEVSRVSPEHGLVLIEDGWRADSNFIRRKVLGSRVLGSAAIGICYAGLGRAFGYIGVPVSIWDYAAASLVARECGLACVDMMSSKPRELGMSARAWPVVGTKDDMGLLLSLKEQAEAGYRDAG